MKLDYNFFEKNINKFNVPTIPFSGVDIIEIRIIDRHDVNNDNIYGQSRQNDEITKRSESFAKSFLQCFDFNQPLPIAELRPDKKYDRVDGFGRDDFFENHNIRYYPHLVVRCKNDVTRRKLRLWANRKLPKYENSENDLTYAIIEAVEMKELSNSKKDFKKFLKETEPHIHNISIDRIINTVCDRLKTKEPKKKTWSYSDKGLKSKWVDMHWANVPSYGFITGNKFNKDGKCFQIAIPYGYEDRKIVTIIKNYIEKGYPTEVLLHTMCGAKSKETIEINRRKCLENIKRITESFDKLYNKKFDWNSIIKIKGFVPQCIDENPKFLINVNRYSVK